MICCLRKQKPRRGGSLCVVLHEGRIGKFLGSRQFQRRFFGRRKNLKTGSAGETDSEKGFFHVARMLHMCSDLLQKL